MKVKLVTNVNLWDSDMLTCKKISKAIVPSPVLPFCNVEPMFGERARHKNVLAIVANCQSFHLVTWEIN